jgi:preprotein translocase subunit SecG
MTILINILLVLEVVVALLMMLVILMQRPKSEGLGAAFGGGVTENIFGAQTTNVLTTITTWLASIFFGLALMLSILYAHRTISGSAVRRQLEKSAAASNAVAPLPPKAAAKRAAADAKAEVKAQTIPTKPVGSPSAADLAVGAAPVQAASPSGTPAPSATPAP